MLIAGALGTMGLPHVLVRFYTNPDGRAARRTTVAVLAMIGGFYIVAVLVGVLARLYTPDLLSTGETDAAVLLVPSAALGQGWTAWLLGGLVAAGTAAAFLSTSSGLVVSLAGVLFTDVLRGRWKDFRLAAVCSALLPIAMALTVKRLDFALTVPLVFAVAASTFCPLLVLGIWWRGLTARGAAAGVLVGGVLSTSAVLASLFVPLPRGPARPAALPARDRHRAGRVPDDGAGQPDDPGRGAGGRRRRAPAPARPRTPRPHPRSGLSSRGRIFQARFLS